MVRIGCTPIHFWKLRKCNKCLIISKINGFMLTCWYYYLFYPHHCSSIIISKVHLQQTSVKMFGFILIRFANANNVAVCCATIKKTRQFENLFVTSVNETWLWTYATTLKKSIYAVEGLVFFQVLILSKMSNIFKAITN